MGRYKKRNLLYWGVDYIKCFISEHKNNNKNFKKLKGLSVNSNQFFIDYNGNNLSITSIPGGKYQHLYSISYDSISVGFIGLYGGQSPDMIEITGQGLTIFGEAIFYHLFDYFGLHFQKFKRIDLCFDMEIQINYFFEKILDKSYKEKDTTTGEYIKTFKPWITAKNGVETIEIGNKNIKQNSYSFIRIYNKILDSKKKGKLFLYENLYKNEDGTRKDITRFEVELREDLCKHYPFGFAKDYKANFFRLVKSFYKMNSQFFKFLKDDDFFEFKKEYNDKNKTIIQKIRAGITGVIPQTLSQARAKRVAEKKEAQDKYGNDFIDEDDRLRTITTYLSYAKRLKINGYEFKIDENEGIPYPIKPKNEEKMA